MNAPKEKAASPGGGDAASNKKTSCGNHTAIKTCFKALIVGAACWGLLPVKLADWIICRGGMRDG